MRQKPFRVKNTENCQNVTTCPSGTPGELGREPTHPFDTASKGHGPYRSPSRRSQLKQQNSKRFEIRDTMENNVPLSSRRGGGGDAGDGSGCGSSAQASEAFSSSSFGSSIGVSSSVFRAATKVSKGHGMNRSKGPRGTSGRATSGDYCCWMESCYALTFSPLLPLRLLMLLLLLLLRVVIADNYKGTD